MPQVLTIELADEAYGRLADVARRSGMTVEEWMLRRIRPFMLTAEERKAELAKLMAFAGSCESTRGTAENESIDRDLVASYMDPHEEK